VTWTIDAQRAKGGIMLRTFAFVIATAFAMPATADCASEQKSITQEMIQWMERLKTKQGSGMCQMARDSQVFYRKAADFYRRCPINDPGGGMLRNSEDMVRWGRDVERETCN
jgi:hypothetical protein